MRYKLVLAKMEVKHVERTPTGWKFSMELPGLGFLVTTAPPQVNIKVNDLLTLYTEVLVDDRGQWPRLKLFCRGG